MTAKRLVQTNGDERFARNAFAAKTSRTKRSWCLVGSLCYNSWARVFAFLLSCCRFLREFDRADRDPAMSAAKLREFEIMLRKLFVEGWILVDPSVSKVPAAPQGPSQQAPCDPLLEGHNPNRLRAD